MQYKTFISVLEKMMFTFLPAHCMPRTGCQIMFAESKKTFLLRGDTSHRSVVSAHQVFVW